METKEMIEYIKELYGYCLVFSHKMPMVDRKENDKIIVAIVKTLKHHDTLKDINEKLVAFMEEVSSKLKGNN